jgi:CBS domain-containing protein
MSEATMQKPATSHWPLAGKTARDLMSANPVSIESTATVPEVLAFLTDTGYSAAPVIDEAGQPIGVVSRTDVVVYERSLTSAPATVGEKLVVRARDLMTPAVFSVSPETPAADVIGQMVDLNVHRLFVLDRAGVIIGVISALDLLRQLRP